MAGSSRMVPRVSGDGAPQQPPLKILLTLAYFHRFNGAQRGLHVIAHGMRERGHETIIAVTGEGRATSAFRADGFDVRRLPVVPELNVFGRGLTRRGIGAKVRALGGLVRLNLRVTRLVMRERIDVVHCAEARAAISFGIGARLAGRPLVVHVVGGPGTFPAPLRYLSALLATRLILVAEALRESLPAPLRTKGVTVRRGVDLRPPVQPPARRPADGIRLLQLASLDPHKGQHHLLQAVARLPERVRERLEVMLVGDTVDADYERHVLALARSLPPARMTRRSWTADPGAVLGSADIVVHPAIERETIFLDGRAVEVRSGEGIPNALIEAGLAGKPTIGSRVGGIPEVVEHERTGLLVPPGDQAALASAIERLAVDPALREALGANARRFVTARFDPRAALDAVEAVYREVARVGGGSADAGAARRGRTTRPWRRRRR
jgi:glycosyltransferase involved in cell wall biosynthesis